MVVCVVCGSARLYFRFFVITIVEKAVGTCCTCRLTIVYFCLTHSIYFGLSFLSMCGCVGWTPSVLAHLVPCLAVVALYRLVHTLVRLAGIRGNSVQIILADIMYACADRKFRLACCRSEISALRTRLAILQQTSGQMARGNTNKRARKEN